VYRGMVWESGRGDGRLGGSRARWGDGSGGEGRNGISDKHGGSQAGWTWGRAEQDREASIMVLRDLMSRPLCLVR
jgi:hypothetical protein